MAATAALVEALPIQPHILLVAAVLVDILAQVDLAEVLYTLLFTMVLLELVAQAAAVALLNMALARAAV